MVHDKVKIFSDDHNKVVDGLRINENIILLIFCTNQNIFRGAARNSRQVATCYTELLLNSEVSSLKISYRKKS